MNESPSKAHAHVLHGSMDVLLEHWTGEFKKKKNVEKKPWPPIIFSESCSLAGSNNTSTRKPKKDFYFCVTSVLCGTAILWAPRHSRMRSCVSHAAGFHVIRSDQWARRRDRAVTSETIQFIFLANMFFINRKKKYMT